MHTKDPETAIGGRSGRFPSTQWSAIISLRDGNPDREVALESLIRMYWKPVYKYLRIRWRKSNEDAKDLTQSFFARLIEKDFIRTYDPSISRFRTFLRTCLDGFASNELKAANARKRGGAFRFESLDFHQAEAEVRNSPPTPEECFEREWIRSLFSLTLEELRARLEETGRKTHYLIFEKYDIERSSEEKLSYDDLAVEFGIPVSAVTNYLSFARREFRKIALTKLREITGSESEYRSEARRVFGARVD